MKQLIIVICVIVLVFSFSGIASALPGAYMFKMFGNDSNTDEGLIEAKIEKWFADNNISHDPVELQFHEKVNTPGTTKGGLTVSYTNSKTGTWLSDKPVEYYSVKAGNGFAFYWLGKDGASSAEWSTVKRRNKDLSHLSVWNSLEAPIIPPEVPEPGTILMLSAGLLGLFAVGRKRMKK